CSRVSFWRSSLRSGGRRTSPTPYRTWAVSGSTRSGSGGRSPSWLLHPIRGAEARVPQPTGGH
ncbi:MAG: Twitching motility protein PilT, partial [uncultured Rubrobacteraceae bacterium]